MLFKNATFYTFSKPFESTAELLEEALEANFIRDIGPQEAYVLGWDYSEPASKTVLLDANGIFLLKLSKFEKQLSSSAINTAVTAKAEELREIEGRFATRKEREQMKEDIIAAQLPNILPKKTSLLLYIDTANQMLVINSHSEKACDEATSFLRKTIGSLPVRSFDADKAPASYMYSWLNDETTIPSGIELLNAGVFTGSDGATIRYKAFDDEDLAKMANEQGMSVEELRADYQEELQFTITRKLGLKSIKWALNDEEDYEDQLDMLNGTLFLNANMLKKLHDILFSGYQL